MIELNARSNGEKVSMLLGAVLSFAFVGDWAGMYGWLASMCAFACVVFFVRRNLCVHRLGALLCSFILAIIIWYSASLFYSSSEFKYGVYKSLAVSFYFLVVLFLAFSYTHLSKRALVFGFLYPLVLLGGFIAVVGLVKFFLLEHGILVGVLLDKFGPQGYPSGTALRSDYNMSSLLLLVASIACVRLYFYKPSFWVFAFLVFMLSAGLLSGSRRFMLMAMLIPVYWIALIWMERGRSSALMLSSFGVLLLGGVFTYALVISVSSAEKFQQVRAGEAWQVLSVQGFKLQSFDEYISQGLMQTDPHLDKSELPAEGSLVLKEPWRTYPQVLANTMSAQEQFGFESRIVRWAFAWDLIKDSLWFGSGFSYHEKFSCKFVACKHVDYPHSPLLSAWLAGGVGLFVLVCIFYSLLGLLAIWHGSVGLKFAVTPIVLMVVPFSLLSGDTVFSISAFVGSSFIALLVILRKN